jgi:hypothetical protein
MEEGGVVVAGTATEVAGPSSSAVSTTVSAVVISEVVTGPGGAGSGSSAALTLLNATPTAPIAIRALAPTPADATLNCFDLTSDHSISVWSAAPIQPGRPVEQCVGVAFDPSGLRGNRRGRE